MKTLFTLIIWLACFGAAYSSQPHCGKGEGPRVIKPMQNWDIIATNTGVIATAPAFCGTNLTYSFSAHPTNPKNIVTINRTGVIRVKAEKKDNFDITVKAKNACGSVSNKFNVIIDEEE